MELKRRIKFGSPCEFAISLENEIILDNGKLSNEIDVIIFRMVHKVRII